MLKPLSNKWSDFSPVKSSSVLASLLCESGYDHNTPEKVKWLRCTRQSAKCSWEAKQSQANSLQPQSAFLVISAGQYFAVQMYWQFQAKMLCVLGAGFVYVLLAIESFVHTFILHKIQHCPWLDAPQLLCQLSASSSAPSLPTAESSDYSKPLSLQVALL